MKDSSIAIPGFSDDFVTRDDERLFAFIDTLRASVRAKVATEQQRGLSLPEIVVEVREMVRLAEEDVQHLKTFPTHAFAAIHKQAAAWCAEAYAPLGDPEPLPPVPAKKAPVA